MVLISSKKYACETCIKGHRSSTCKHTDRALFEIKKKGRPVTQCEHCRELRKTKQVHVKCICELKDTGAAVVAPNSCKKVSSQVPESAAFPYGLPEALEASVALQLLSEGSSDSDHGGSCTCKVGGECNCWAPRTSTSRTRRKDQQHSGDVDVDRFADPNRAEYNTSKHNPSAITARAPSNILARISELRPVLPRPPINKEGGLTGPLHVPSSGVGHGRHHHDNTFFSPYGRAYDYARGSHEQLQNGHEVTQHALHINDSEPLLSSDQSYSNQLLQIASSWMPTNESSPFRSLCGCGDGCSCPGCVQHNGASVSFNDPASSSFQSCTNPGACAACIDLSVPDFLQPDTGLSIQDSQSIDEWLRQVSTLPASTPTLLDASVNQVAPGTTGYQGPPWNTFQAPHPYRLSPVGSSCVGQRKCPPGLCRCDYPHSRHEPSSPQGTVPLTSSHCYGKVGHQNDISLTTSANHGSLRTPEQSSHVGSLLMIPNMSRSRSSSVSSQSSAGQKGHRGAIPDTRISASLKMTPIGPPRVPSAAKSNGTYARSNPDSDLSLDDAYSQYDPSLDGIRLY